MNLGTIKQALTARLHAMPRPMSSVGIAVAATKTQAGEGLTVFVQTAPGLTEQLQQLRPYEYPLAVLLHTVHAHRMARPFTNLAPQHSEVAAMARFGLVAASQYGIERDQDCHVLRAPANAIGNTFSQWGEQLLEAYDWHDPHNSDSPPYWFAVCPTPSLLWDDLDESMQERLLDMARGWNHTAVMSPRVRRTQTNDLRMALAQAEQVRTY